MTDWTYPIRVEHPPITPPIAAASLAGVAARKARAAARFSAIDRWLPANMRRLTRFPGYAISDDGEIYSLGTARGLRRLNRQKDRDGYCCVYLRDAGKRIRVFHHKAVASAFLPSRPSEAHVLRHWDGNKENNSPSNLLWGTPQQNSDDRDRHGRTQRGSRHYRAKLTEADIPKIRALADQFSYAEIARRYSVTDVTIGLIAKNKIWRHVP